MTAVSAVSDQSSLTWLAEFETVAHAHSPSGLRVLDTKLFVFCLIDQSASVFFVVPSSQLQILMLEEAKFQSSYLFSVYNHFLIRSYNFLPLLWIAGTTSVLCLCICHFCWQEPFTPKYPPLVSLRSLFVSQWGPEHSPGACIPSSSATQFLFSYFSPQHSLLPGRWHIYLINIFIVGFSPPKYELPWGRYFLSTLLLPYLAPKVVPGPQRLLNRHLLLETSSSTFFWLLFQSVFYRKPSWFLITENWDS